MKKNLLPVMVSLAGLFPLALSAALVTEAQSRAVARAWLKENSSFAGYVAEDAAVRAQKDDDGRILWYEVPTTEGGCVITSSDTSLEPVIAYADCASDGIAEDSPLHAMLKGDLENRLAVIAGASHGGLKLSTSSVSELEASMRKAEAKWGRLSSDSKLKLTTSASTGVTPSVIVSHIPEWRIDRLTHWNQNKNSAGAYCYDLYTPNHYPCGCVATAGATLLQYFNLTTAPTVTKSCKVDGTTRSLTTKGVDYDWLNLSNELYGRVTYDMGVCLGMSYTSSGSSASTYTLAESLKNNFGLSSAQYAGVSSSSQYLPYIYAQNRAGAPVVLSIARSGGGHAVLAVGYAEDSSGSPYTRVFMGWGGNYDAWYALPNISNYSSINGVVTLLGKDAETAAICGRVKTSAGNPLAYADVAYDGVNRFVTDANGFWAGRVAQDGKTHTLTCAGVSKSVAIGSSLSTLPSAAIDFVVPATSLPLVYEDAETVRVRALESGRMIFLMNGATWCSYCTKLKGYLASLGQSFEDRYAYILHDHDVNRYGLKTYGTPSWGCYDPRNFDIANKFEAHASRLYYGGGCPSTISYFNSYLASAETKWEALKSAPVSVDLGSSDVISGITELKAKATFSDGVTALFSKDVTWKIVAGTAATVQGGRINPKPGVTGSVLLMGEATVMGEKYVFFHTVNITGGVALTGITIEGPDTLDLYEAACAAYTVRVTYSNGTKGYLDATWSLGQSAPTVARLDNSGVLSFTKYDDMSAPFEVVVKAVCGGFTDTKRVTVIPPASVTSFSGVFEKNALWPGATLKFIPTCVQERRYGEKERIAASADGFATHWQTYTSNSDYRQGEDISAITLPTTVSANTDVFIRCMPQGGRYVAFGWQEVKGVNVYSSEPTWVNVSFDTGGLQTIPTVKYPKGGKYLVLPKVAKLGYSTEWYTAKTGGSKVTAGSQSTTVPSTGHTLYARFSPAYFYIYFYANDGSDDNVGRWFYYDTEGTFPLKPFSRTGYRFEGWATSPDGAVVYQDGEKVFNWYASYTTVELYAVWRELELQRACINGPDAVLSSSAQMNVDIDFGEGDNLSLSSGITWRVVSGSAATVSSAGVVTPVSGKSGSVTVEAAFTYRGKSFCLTKILRVLTSGELTAKWISGKSVWMPDEAKESTPYSLKVMDGAGNEYVIAADSWAASSWTPSSGSSTFSDNYTLSSSGVLSCIQEGRNGTVTLTAKIGSLAITKTVQTYACARVDKWIPRPSSSVLYPGATVQMNDEFFVRRANGEVLQTLGYADLDRYSLYFYQSDGSTDVFTSADKPSIANNVMTVPATAVCNHDDGLVHFETSAQSYGSGRFSYWQSGSFLFAWYNTKPTLIDVTFDANGGQVEERSAITRSYAASQTYKTLPTAIKTGAVFDGWYTAKTGGSKVTTTSTASSKAHTLYARWTSGKLWLYLYPNDGSAGNAYSRTTAQFEAEMLPANPFTRTGYVFEGWSLTKAPSYAEGTFFPNQAPLKSLPAFSGGLSLYAIWRETAGNEIPVRGSDVSVPKAWLDRHKTLLANNGGDYTKTLTAKAANGRSVYDCYVAGLDPEDPTDDFTLDIAFENGLPVLDFNAKSGRAYTVWGSDDLKTWHKTSSAESYNFFKVTVELR